MWPGRAKGLFMPKPVACTHWVFLIVEKLYLETGHNKLPPAQRAILFCPKVPPRFLSWPVLWAWASGCLCLYYDSVNGVPLSFQAIKEKKACKRSFFSFGKLLKFVLLLLVAAVAIDIYKHKGYKGKMLLVCFPLCEVFGRCSLHFQVLSSVFFLLKASKTAQIAKDYGLEQAALTGYGQAKNGFDVANR